MRIANKIIMMLAGLLLVIGTLLKFQQLLTACVSSWQDNPTGFWESYEFFLIQIPLEFGLGVWMISGLFRKASWILGTLAYFGFIFVTLTKVLTGAESCGCFGQVHVDPRITLFAIDIPFFLLLAIFRPKGYKLLPPPWPNVSYLLIVAVVTIGFIVLSAPMLITFKPECIKVEDDKPDPAAKLKLEIFKLKQDIKNLTQEAVSLREQLQTSQQTIELQQQQIISLQEQLQNQQEKNQILLDPNIINEEILSKDKNLRLVQDLVLDENGREVQLMESVKLWDWLQYVVEEDVRDQLTQGLVVVLMYHHDCEICAEVVPAYSEYYKTMMDQDSDIPLKIAFLAIPPYDEEGPVPEDTTCILGKLTDEKDWLIMSPYVVALLEGEKVRQWEQGTAPEPENLLTEIFPQY